MRLLLTLLLFSSYERCICTIVRPLPAAFYPTRAPEEAGLCWFSGFVIQIMQITCMQFTPPKLADFSSRIQELCLNIPSNLLPECQRRNMWIMNSQYSLKSKWEVPGWPAAILHFGFNGHCAIPTMQYDCYRRTVRIKTSGRQVINFVVKPYWVHC